MISISVSFGGMSPSSRRRAGWLGSHGSGARDPSCGSPAPASNGVGLGGVRPVKSPPGSTTIAHGVLVGWSAARAEHRGRAWKSARELAVERETWAVKARCERGYTEQLPDLAVWLERSGPPVAVIAESGGRREDRQKMILEGWPTQSCPDATPPFTTTAPASVAHWINRLAKKVGLTGRTFHVEVQLTAEEIAALSPAANDEPETTEPRPHPDTPSEDPDAAPTGPLPPLHQTRWRLRRAASSHRRHPGPSCLATPRATLYTERSSELKLRRAGDGDDDTFQARPAQPGAFFFFPSRSIAVFV